MSISKRGRNGLSTDLSNNFRSTAHATVKSPANTGSKLHWIPFLFCCSQIFSPLFVTAWRLLHYANKLSAYKLDMCSGHSSTRGRRIYSAKHEYMEVRAADLLPQSLPNKSHIVSPMSHPSHINLQVFCANLLKKFKKSVKVIADLMIFSQRWLSLLLTCTYIVLIIIIIWLKRKYSSLRLVSADLSLRDVSVYCCLRLWRR